MNDMSDLPSRDHNQPPGEILPVLPPVKANDDPDLVSAIEAARDAAAAAETKPVYNVEAHAALEANVAAFCDACAAWKALGKIEAAEQSERLTDFITGARGLWKRVEDQRKAEKKVFDDMGKEVHKAYGLLAVKVERVGDDMKAMQADWLKRENARIVAERAAREAELEHEREEARRLQAQADARGDISGAVDAEEALKATEKALKQAAKPVSAKAASATGAGRSMSLRRTPSAKLINVNHGFMHYRDHPEVAELLERLATAEIRHQQGEKIAPPGFEIQWKESV